MRPTSPWLLDLLLEHSTNKYFIEYWGFLSNHLAHGVIALDRLGASRERIDRFIKWYIEKLDPAEPHLREEKPNETKVTEADIQNLLGKRQSFYVLHKYYEDLLHGKYCGNLDAFVSGEFAKVADGMVCCALHGLIHTGYGFSVRSEKITLEGIAYLHHSYLPMQVSDECAKECSLKNFGKGKTDILDVLKKVQDDKGLRETMLKEADRLDKTGFGRGVFQQRVAGLFDTSGDKLLRLVHEIELPDFFDPSSEDLGQLRKLSDWALNCAITVYATSVQVNDFLLIHGVTSAYSLKQIVRAMTNYTEGLRAIRTYLCCLVTTYVAQDTPDLTKDSTAHAKDGPIDQAKWDQLLTATIAPDRDEHIYKLAQVCYGLWLDNPESELSGLYYTATHIAHHNKLCMTFLGSC